MFKQKLWSGKKLRKCVLQVFEETKEEFCASDLERAFKNVSVAKLNYVIRNLWLAGYLERRVVNERVKWRKSYVYKVKGVWIAIRERHFLRDSLRQEFLRNDEKISELKGWQDYLLQKREVIGHKRLVSHIERGDSNIDEQKVVCGIGYAEKIDKSLQFHTLPASDEAKLLDGSYAGFQPKPAVEVILVCMKPLSERTFVEQALENGKGITWIDDCRIPFDVGDKNLRLNRKDHNLSFNSGFAAFVKEGFDRNTYAKDLGAHDSQGRFPANLLVSDDVLNDGKVTKGVQSIRRNRSGIFTNQGNEMSSYGYGDVEGGYNDSGGFSRYFDLDAWWESQIKNLPKRLRKTIPFLILPKASKSEKNRYADKNMHATVKPVKLGSYLVILGSQENDLVLDPFVGSGSFAISAILSNRNYMGFEISKEFHKIAVSRTKTFKKRGNLLKYFKKKKVPEGRKAEPKAESAPQDGGVLR